MRRALSLALFLTLYTCSVVGRNVVVVPVSQEANVVNQVRVLHHALLEAQLEADLVVVTAEDTVASVVRETWEAEGIKILPARPQYTNLPLNLALLPPASVVGAALASWSLVQYDRVLLLAGAHVQLLAQDVARSHASLQALLAPAACQAEACALAREAWLETGVMVLTPSKTRFEGLVAALVVALNSADEQVSPSQLDLAWVLHAFQARQPDFAVQPLAAEWAVGCGLDAPRDALLVDVHCGTPALGSVAPCAAGDATPACQNEYLQTYQRLMKAVDPCTGIGSSAQCAAAPGCGWCASACTSYLSLCLHAQHREEVGAALLLSLAETTRHRKQHHHQTPAQPASAPATPAATPAATPTEPRLKEAQQQHQEQQQQQQQQHAQQQEQQLTRRQELEKLEEVTTARLLALKRDEAKLEIEVAVHKEQLAHTAHQLHVHISQLKHQQAKLEAEIVSTKQRLALRDQPKLKQQQKQQTQQTRHQPKPKSQSTTPPSPKPFSAQPRLQRVERTERVQGLAPIGSDIPPVPTLCAGTLKCHAHAQCQQGEVEHCVCDYGYAGDGLTCAVADFWTCFPGSEDPQDRCHAKAECVPGGGSGGQAGDSLLHDESGAVPLAYPPGGSQPRFQQVRDMPANVCRCNLGYYGNGAFCDLWGFPPKPQIDITMDCNERLIDRMDELFRSPPVMQDHYIIRCRGCSYPNDKHGLPAWGGPDWYSFDSVFCAAAKHATNYPEGGKFLVTMEYNVLTNRVRDFKSFTATGKSRQWQGSYPVVFSVQEIPTSGNGVSQPQDSLLEMPQQPEIPPENELIAAAEHTAVQPSRGPTPLTDSAMEALRQLARR